MKAPHERERQLPNRGPCRRWHRPRSHGPGARHSSRRNDAHARPAPALYPGACGRRPLSRHWHCASGQHGQAVRAGRCHSARGLRAAPYPLSRSDRDHAAGGIALHLRPLCRRASVPAHPWDPEPDRGSGRARDRSRRDPGIDRRPVCFHGQGRRHGDRGTRDAPDHAQHLRAPVRFFSSIGAAPQGARRPWPPHLRRQSERVQGLCLLSPDIR